MQYYADEWNLKLGTDGWDRSYVGSARGQGEAETGCFGMRIMWGDMPAFLKRLAVLFSREPGDRDRLQAAFGVESFVYLSRADKVAQAVSLAIATQTGLWHRNADGSVREQAEHGGPARYDHALIAANLTMLETEQKGWNTWFANQSITPLELTYEALALDPAACAKNVFRFLGHTHDDLPTVGTARLATALNREWAERFRLENQQTLPARSLS